MRQTARKSECLRPWTATECRAFLFCCALCHSPGRRFLHPVEVGRKALKSFRKVNDKNVKGSLFPVVLGVTGNKIGFHAFRRFRATHLRIGGCARGFRYVLARPQGKTITDCYLKMKERLELRKEWAEKAGIGFNLPAEKVVIMTAGKTATKKESAA
jgi:hypothetical protein